MSVKLFLAIVLVCVCCGESRSVSGQFESAKGHWESWKMTHQKFYTTALEESVRFENFEENLKIIADLNAKHNPRTYFAVNQFSDMSNKEFKQWVKGAGASLKSAIPTAGSHVSSKKQIPPSVDWRAQGAVSPVYNQGQCGSSPYFAAVTSIEGVWKISGHTLVTLSSQQIIDCSQNYGNAGCNGGWMNQSITYAAAFGLQTNATYPYTGTDDTCKYDRTKVVAHVSKFIETDGSEAALQEALVIAPVASSVNAGDPAFQNYQSGILNDPSCDPNQNSHGIGIVGYGADSKGQQYYILKNSWGIDWGMNGYILIARNAKNMCGIATDACYAVA